MSGPYGKRLWMVVSVLAVLAAAVVAWRLLRTPVPYSLHATPAVNVSVRAAQSEYPDVPELADDVELLVKAYVQRLAAGDTTDLARLGAPWYTGQDRAAQKLVTAYRAHTGGPVDAIVEEPVVPYLAAVELRFGDGRRQTLQLSRDHDDVWWLQLGDGDPVAP
ncbi:hypothetical protein [Streptomyces echinatus]|uniref:hypothetical protein n=1 Tax=Streptomyces echinatus TaxID=67293 RepID=UPI0038240DE3